jgi:hypothetical protein
MLSQFVFASAELTTEALTEKEMSAARKWVMVRDLPSYTGLKVELDVVKSIALIDVLKTLSNAFRRQTITIDLSCNERCSYRKNGSVDQVEIDDVTSNKIKNLMWRAGVKWITGDPLTDGFNGKLVCITALTSDFGPRYSVCHLKYDLFENRGGPGGMVFE